MPPSPWTPSRLQRSSLPHPKLQSLTSTTIDRVTASARSTRGLAIEIFVRRDGNILEISVLRMRAKGLSNK
jgi:hypothetical protein